MKWRATPGDASRLHSVHLKGLTGTVRETVGLHVSDSGLRIEGLERFVGLLNAYN